MAFQTILASDFAVNVIYPFLLIFTLIFAILQKSKILGEDKKQIDALVALSIALIAVAFTWATGIISKLMPFLAIAAVILLIFLILYGFVASSNKDGLVLHKNLVIAFGVLIAVSLVIAVLFATGQWDRVYNSVFSSGQPTNLASNVFLIAVVVGAFALLWFSTGKKKE